jgi:hypothetical protein
MRAAWLSLAVLILFLLVSIAALSGVGRNIVQKRDVYSDPLCKAFWDKPHYAVKNISPRMAGKQERNPGERISERRAPYTATQGST